MAGFACLISIVTRTPPSSFGASTALETGDARRVETLEKYSKKKASKDKMHVGEKGLVVLVVRPAERLDRC